MQVEVVILDKNDSPPEFKNIPAAYMASEDMAPGQRIATISAEDPDTIGSITYSIQNDEPTPFSLDPQTGLLTLKDPLDRETTSEYQVIVRADDGVQFTDVTVVVQVCCFLYEKLELRTVVIKILRSCNIRRTLVNRSTFTFYDDIMNLF